MEVDKALLKSFVKSDEDVYEFTSTQILKKKTSDSKKTSTIPIANKRDTSITPNIVCFVQSVIFTYLWIININHFHYCS